MKIVIDIPKSTIEHIRKQYENGVYGIWNDDSVVVQRGIYNAKKFPKGIAMTSKDVRIAIEKQKPKCPTTYIVNGVGIQKRCPTCDKILYDNDWSAPMNREGFTQYCIYCGQRFTKKGRYLGEWEVEDADSN